MVSKKDIEKLENSYLEEFYHFLKFVEKRMFKGFQTKEEIREYWIKQWNPDEQENGKGISSFAVGAERVIYALFNAHGFGQPNSAPIGSDLFFETNDAFIHIDLKTVQTRNLVDYNKDIFVGNNQTSYNGKVIVSGKERVYNKAALPQVYKVRGKEKPCLTYFITILYEEKDLNILNINILSMPNGLLSDIYNADTLKAGKNPGINKGYQEKVRFKFSKTPSFRLLENKKRVKVVYFDSKMEKKFLDKLKFIKSIYDSQTN